MKIVAIVQARMGSSRLPNKVMLPISGKPMIEVLLHRLSQAKSIHQIVLATSKNEENTLLVNHVSSLGYTCYQGDEEDVLSRYHDAAQSVNADIVIRITGDCPLVDSELIEQMITDFKETPCDYLSNIEPPTFPDGLDVEIFNYSALETANQQANTTFDREHVTPYIRNKPSFKRRNFRNDTDLSGLRWTVDEPEDIKVIRNIFSHYAPRIDFSRFETQALYTSKPEIFLSNQSINRNEGSQMNKGQKLWNRAKRVIPGGNMLLSKRPEMFLPEHWPAYFSKAKGCTVWDLEGNAFTDMSIMGVGTNILGYAHPEIDAVVSQVVSSGNMSTLNCPEEVYLAERLVEIHPWADMVRFARSGGEANAIAVRIARAASGRDKVAFCGYHGWHDWYLSANLDSEGKLDGHLLPGLEPNGVPRSLSGTVLPFEYNDFQGLKDLVDQHDIGVIKMEVSRNKGPEDNFLQKVRSLADENNIVLIFDECTSGFRQTFGGLHKHYGVEPDLAVFGKALGNGYSITCTIGRREIMEAAQSTFISSTFWTERIGPAAALKTLEVMEETQSWDKITQTGLKIRNGWQELADKYDLKINHWGLPALTGFTFESSDALEYKTLITQEMLKKGYLAGNSVYVCTEHNDDVLDGFFTELDPIFRKIQECEHDRKIHSLLDGPVCHSGFKRLN